MRLSLNLPLEALHDERGLAWDVSDKGHWGNGPTRGRTRRDVGLRLRHGPGPAGARVPDGRRLSEARVPLTLARASEATDPVVKAKVRT